MTKTKVDKKRKRRVANRGGLVMIAGLLMVSAALRMGDNAGQAFALAPEKIGATPLEPVLVTKPASENFEVMLAAFQKREARLKEKESALRDRIHALNIVDEQVTQKLEALTAAETALRDMIALAETAAEGDLARLTKVYETMKPKQAAALFEEMAPEFAAGFLGRMRPDAAAAILAGLNPESAHRFSVVLAGRNANVPSE